MAGGGAPVEHVLFADQKRGDAAGLGSQSRWPAHSSETPSYAVSCVSRRRMTSLALVLFSCGRPLEEEEEHHQESDGGPSAVRLSNYTILRSSARAAH